MDNSMQEDLMSAIEPEVEKNNDQAPLSDESFEAIAQSLLGLQASMSELFAGIHTLSHRIATLETFVSFLAKKDPTISEKIKAISQAAESESEQS